MTSNGRPLLLGSEWCRQCHPYGYEPADLIAHWLGGDTGGLKVDMAVLWARALYELLHGMREAGMTLSGEKAIEKTKRLHWTGAVDMGWWGWSKGAEFENLLSLWWRLRSSVKGPELDDSYEALDAIWLHVEKAQVMCVVLLVCWSILMHRPSTDKNNKGLFGSPTSTVVGVGVSLYNIFPPPKLETCRTDQQDW